MRTNIVLDDALVEEALRVTQVQTKKEVVERALRELVARHHQRKILDLVGEPLFDPAYDVGAMRERMTRDLG